jgi:hypothetical protein
MKQNITDKQLSQLNEAQRIFLAQWCANRGYGSNLSIGQMIELINEKKPLKGISKARFDKWTVNIETSTLGYKDELCDALFETVTRIL